MEWRPSPSQDRVAAVLESWERTPYMQGAACKGAGVDCVRFVCAVLDELYGRYREPIQTVPQDAAFHDRRTAITGMRRVIEAYGPAEKLRPGAPVEAGDILVTGPQGGGPGHAMIVGVRQLWHSTGERVQRAGLTLGRWRLFRIYRPQEKHLWA